MPSSEASGGSAATMPCPACQYPVPAVAGDIAGICMRCDRDAWKRIADELQEMRTETKTRTLRLYECPVEDCDTVSDDPHYLCCLPLVPRDESRS